MASATTALKNAVLCPANNPKFTKPVAAATAPAVLVLRGRITEQSGRLGSRNLQGWGVICPLAGLPAMLGKFGAPGNAGRSLKDELWRLGQIDDTLQCLLEDCKMINFGRANGGKDRDHIQVGYFCNEGGVQTAAPLFDCGEMKRRGLRDRS